MNFLEVFCIRYDLHIFFSLNSASLVSFYVYFVKAVLENSIDFSKSIFSCSKGEEATGAYFPPFFAPFFSYFYVMFEILLRDYFLRLLWALLQQLKVFSHLFRSFSDEVFALYWKELLWHHKYLSVLWSMLPKYSQKVLQRDNQ